MAAESPKPIRGYVSAYLKQTLRTHAEAEQDNREQNASVEVREPLGRPSIESRRSASGGE